MPEYMIQSVQPLCHYSRFLSNLFYATPAPPLDQFDRLLDLDATVLGGDINTSRAKATLASGDSSAAELGLIALTIEGGLIAPEQVQRVMAADRTAKTADSYACPKGTSLGDEIARYFRIGQAIWRDYDKAEAKTIQRTALFAHDLLAQCLGFTDLIGPVEHRDSNRHYRITWEAKAGRVPIVAAAPVADADAFAKSQTEFGDAEGGRARRSPVALLQDWLNGTDHALWGLVFAGDRARLMRDNGSLTRPAWIEADLGAMFRDEMFADFTAFWLLAHATRFGAEGAAVSDCALEQWREAGLKQGVEARKDLYANVATALEELGQGLVQANPEVRDRLQSGAVSMQTLFEELLRGVYRLIFLAVAEDRDLLHPRRTAKDDQFRQGHIGQRTVSADAGEYQLATRNAKPRASLNDAERAAGEGDDMLAECFHAPLGKLPETLFEVKLIPCRAAHLAGSCRRENGKFQRQPTKRFPLAQRLNERRYIFVGHRSKMIVAARLAGQSLSDRPHGCLGVAIARRVGPIENRADALADAPRRLGLVEPDFL